MITCDAKRHGRSRWAWLSAAGSLGMLVAGAASAEQASRTAANAPDPPAVSGDKAGELQEVVVTAQRRAEAVMDVPLSVTAYSGEALATVGVPDTSALQVATPGLIYSKEGSSVQFYIRGVG